MTDAPTNAPTPTTVAAPPTRGAGPRRGIAMPLVLTAVVGLTLLSAGAFTASRETFRAGRNALVEQRAMAVAEFGLNQRISIWNPRFNLPVEMGGVPVGSVDSSSLYVEVGDTARVRLTRLTPLMYSVESVGRASIPRPQLQSVRSVASLVRLAYPEIRPKGALTAAAAVMVKGDAKINGQDSVPDTWTAAECAALRGTDMPAITVPPNTLVQIQTNGANAANVVGGVSYDPTAADSNTYVRFGTVMWNELVANATVTIPAGTYAPEPTQVGNSCNFTLNNWGEPFRDTLTNSRAVRPCVNFFPIVYASGNITLNGNGRGQGILLVNGDVKLAGQFQWVGLIIARDDIDGSVGTADVFGGVMAANLKLDSKANDGAVVAGTQRMQYSRCGVESAIRGSAALVRVRDRGWAQVF